MTTSQDEILTRVGGVMQRVFFAPASLVISRSTSSPDVAGWDSLSHSLFILGVEDEFGLDLPIDKTYEMNDLGDLVDLIAACQLKAQPTS